MAEILTRCGYRCDLCLAYAPNIAREDLRQELSDGWFKYFGFRIPPEDIYCEGCMSGDKPRLIDKGCPVRPCVIERDLDNCAACPEYGCEKLQQRWVERVKVAGRLQIEIPEEEYQLFIRPYENKQRLDAVREQKQPPGKESSSMGFTPGNHN